MCRVVPAEQGYDPFNPEVVRPQVQQNGKPAGSGDLSGALELVNRAIEEVRSEVEKEKRKLSRIGDEPYDPSESTSLSSSNAIKSKTPPSHMAYDPGSYQMTTEGYNPTPGCSKYTLDSDDPGNNSNSMEYVPTLVKKPSSRTHTHQLPSPPPSPKYSNSTSSSKCKYTVDNSKPSTDMEYDPLSNYTAGIAVKSKRDKRAQVVKMEGNKTYKLPGSDEECVVAVKKPRQHSVDSKKYTFSDSDGESSGTEYRPTSLSNLQQRKGNSGSLWDAVRNERKERTESMFNVLTQRYKEDLAGDVQERLKRKDSLEKKKVASRSSHEKSGKSEKLHNLEKEVKKAAGSKNSGSSSKDKGSIKNSNQVSTKKENKSHGKRDDGKNTNKVKTSDKVQREGRDEKRSDGKIKAVEKVKTDSSKQDKDMENGARESKKAKISDKEKDLSKIKDFHHKNGKLDSSKRAKDIKKISKSSSSSKNSSSSKGSPANSKDKVKQNISSSNGKRREDKRPSLSLSHADLFGDESPEEAEPIEVDDDDEESEEVLVRKSADALKRGRLNKRKASELTPSSSDDEGDCVVVCRGTGKNEVASVGIDFSSFQDDLDFDSDPMEECLRIFNESKDVKKEDKGRQAKQVLVFLSGHTVLFTTYCFFLLLESHFAADQLVDLNKHTMLCPFSPLGIQRRRKAQRAL